MTASVLTVTQLNKYIKSVMEGDINLSNCFIEGEISNFKNHYSSGHFYFSIKDKESVLKCVMFNRLASRIKFNPADGMQVLCRGKISVFERDGQYQLYVEDMQPMGIGALAIRYEQLKEKLQKEGLFDYDTKRELPEIVKRVAIVTAETGAAIHDILSIAERRNPAVEMVVCPVIVQGENAPYSMIKMLDKIYCAEGIDVIIIGRGGGSYEDLYCFNDEELLRKIYESPIPVISAVGHESDFTLCDFIADIRAATPSAAAELAVRDVSEHKIRLSHLLNNLIYGANKCYDLCVERFDRCIDSPIFRDPKEYLSIKKKEVDEAVGKIIALSKSEFNQTHTFFRGVLQALNALNPASVMLRGYSIAKLRDKIIKSADELKNGDIIKVDFSSGSADCEIIDLQKE